MPTKNNAVLKQESHSQGLLLGIFCIRNAKGVKQAKEYEKKPRALRVAYSGLTTLLNKIPLIRTSSTFPLNGEGTPSTWRERTECVSTGVRGCRSAFTLIELLVVVLIIGILSAIALPQYRLAVEKARYMELITVAETIYKAEELYYMTNGKYTHTLTDLDITIPSTSGLHIFVSIIDNKDAYIQAYHSPDLFYLIYLDHHPSAAWRGRRQCRVKSNDEILKKVCQSATGQAVTGKDGNWTAYFR